MECWSGPLVECWSGPRITQEMRPESRIARRTCDAPAFSKLQCSASIWGCMAVACNAQCISGIRACRSSNAPSAPRWQCCMGVVRAQDSRQMPLCVCFECAPLGDSHRRLHLRSHRGVPRLQISRVAQVHRACTPGPHSSAVAGPRSALRRLRGASVRTGWRSALNRCRVAAARRLRALAADAARRPHVIGHDGARLAW